MGPMLTCCFFVHSIRALIDQHACKCFLHARISISLADADLMQKSFKEQNVPYDTAFSGWPSQYFRYKTLKVLLSVSQ